MSGDTEHDVPPMNTGVRDLKLWQEAVALAAEVIRAVRLSSKRERQPLLERLAAAASAIPETIADGYARLDALDQQQLFESARRTLSAVETQLAVARQAAILSPDLTAQLSTRTANVGRLLAGYLTYVERQRTTERDEGVLRISPAAASAPLRKPLDEIYCA